MSNWSAIVGARGDDKTKALDQVLSQLQQQGVRLAGFYQERVVDAADEVLGWDIVRLGGPGRRSLARRSPNPDLCEYAFEAPGFAVAAEWARASDVDLLVVGGLGKLEAAETGHWPLVQTLIEDASAPHALLCIRDTSLSSLAFRLPDPQAHLHLPCESAELTTFCTELARLVRRA